MHDYIVPPPIQSASTYRSFQLNIWCMLFGTSSAGGNHDHADMYTQLGTCFKVLPYNYL